MRFDIRDSSGMPIIVTSSGDAGTHEIWLAEYISDLEDRLDAAERKIFVLEEKNRRLSTSR